MTQVPTGLAGPLRLWGPDAQGKVSIPLATTEGALIASYNRGAKACTAAGGVYAAVLAESIRRSPMFVFRSMAETLQFQAYCLARQDRFAEVIRDCSRHARFERLRSLIEGNQLILHLEFTTGDAAGQNMATFCADEICRFLLAHSPVQPERWYVDAYISGDKKTGSGASPGLGGKKVGAEIVLPAPVVAEVLQQTPRAMVDYFQRHLSASGSAGLNGHVANGLTALFLACGQDVAGVGEAALGCTRLECTAEGDLYAAVTLPNLVVCAAGDQPNDCLSLLGCRGEGQGRRFAAICGALALCGELSSCVTQMEGHKRP